MENSVYNQKNCGLAIAISQTRAAPQVTTTLHSENDSNLILSLSMMFRFSFCLAEKTVQLFFVLRKSFKMRYFIFLTEIFNDGACFLFVHCDSNQIELSENLFSMKNK